MCRPKDQIKKFKSALVRQSDWESKLTGERLTAEISQLKTYIKRRRVGPQ